jgi:hypothetical protein
MGAELFHEDGQTDMTKLMVSFRNMPTHLESPKGALLPLCLLDCIAFSCETLLNTGV